MNEVFDGVFKEIETEVLAPCPFCGKSSSLRVLNSFYNKKEKFFVYCSSVNGGCGCAQDARIYESVEDAVKVWNNRADKNMIEEGFIKAIIARAKERIVEKLSK